MTHSNHGHYIAIDRVVRFLIILDIGEESRTVSYSDVVHQDPDLEPFQLLLDFGVDCLPFGEIHCYSFEED